MADIDVQRKGGISWIWWVLGLIVLALLVWWIVEALKPEDEAAVVPAAAPAVTPTTTPEPVATGPLCVAQVLSEPRTYVGQTLGTCEMRVVDVPTDRGFWIEENGQRVFVVLNEGGQNAADVQGRQAERPDINPGQTIRVDQAIVMDNAGNLPGPIDQQTKQIASRQPWFLAVKSENVQIATAGNPQPGTTGAQTTAGDTTGTL